MSYNGYTQYSPYWQPNSGQSNPQNAGQNVAQSRASYQPLSAYQNSHQSAQPSISHPAKSSSDASYGTKGYGNMSVNGAGNGRPQDYPASYAGTNDRASLDGATALGNLAYASSLGRQGSAQQLATNNRQQSNSNYGTANPYGGMSTPPIQNRTDHERQKSSNSSREDTNARAQQATASPSFGYSSNHAGPSTGNYTQAPSQYPLPASASDQHMLYQNPQQPRPTSGQAVHQPRPKPDSQAATLRTAPSTKRTTNQSQGRKASVNVPEPTQTRVQTPQQSIHPPSSQAPGQSGGHTQRPQSQKGTIKQLTNNASKSNAAAYLSAKETAAKRVSDAQQSPTTDTNRQTDKPATPVEPQYTTVDPSQVFNHAEYSRRQAAAAAEVAATKKAAEEAEAARIAATRTNSPRVNGTPVVASAPSMEPDSARKDQMELEMKQMIEKMRDYKAKDPSLFTQIWEQVKKGQPPQRASSQSLQGSATSPIVVNGQSPSPSVIETQLPPQSDLTASDEFSPDFDRGRFPAQRRRRGGGIKASSGRKSGTPNSSTKPVSQTQTPENNASPVQPELATPTPNIGQISSDPGSQSMQQALEQHHQKIKSPVTMAQQLPGLNKLAMTKTTTSSPKAPPSAAPPSQPLPVHPTSSPKPGGTYWPESKKKALAEAARIALTSTSINQGKAITTQEIHELLDMNPSYIQMCEILEYRGFVIDRGQFARILLKAVPDLGSASSPANPTSTDTANSDRPMPTQLTPILAPSNTTATKATPATSTAASFGMLVKATSNDSEAQKKMPQPLPYSIPPVAVFKPANPYVTPYATTHWSAEHASRGIQSNSHPPASWTPGMPRDPARGFNQGQHEPASHSHPWLAVHEPSGSVKGQVFDQRGAVYPNDLIPQITKQEMARKRTFDEIVDLTQVPDEEVARYKPTARTDNEGAAGPSRFVKNVFDQDSWRQQSGGRSTPKPFKYKYSGRDALLQSYDIIEPMNKRRDALRRSTYNPKTIARDILLAIGKHPGMTPLNAHLDVLKDRFKAVDNESDLSTFRWDIVDPEEEANISRFDTDDEETTPTVVAEARQRPAPMAVMVRGDGADVVRNDQTSSPIMNPVVNVKHFNSGPYKKAGFRSDIQPIGSADIAERQAPQNLAPITDLSNGSGTIPTGTLSRFAYRDRPYTPHAAMTTPDGSNAIFPQAAASEVKRRKGRPPGAKNKQVRPDKGIPKARNHSMDAAPSTPEESLNEEPLGKITPSGTPPIGEAGTPNPTRPRINTTTPSRPSGLRNSINAMTPTDGIAVVIPSRSPSVAVVTPQASVQKGRPKKAEIRSEDGSMASPSSTPTYTMYPCDWEHCPAELHNVETLKKHVKKHRQAVDGVYPCLWADCSDSSKPLSNNMQNEDGQIKRLKFKTDAELVTHVESNHLRTERELSLEARVNGTVGTRPDSNGFGVS